MITICAASSGRMEFKMNQKLFDYIKKAPTAYHACANSARILEEQGYTRLFEGKKWNLEAGKGYFVERNGSSLIAFRVPKSISSFMITAAHGDSPCFKVKDNAELPDQNYLRLSVEKYGGMLCSTWMDRPLSIAGRVVYNTQDGLGIKLFDLGSPCVIIPNVAIHMNRQANDGMKYNPAVDMLPLFGEAAEKGKYMEMVSAAAGVNADDIVSTDAFLYDADEGIEWGEFISAPRIDDLQCAFAALEAFTTSESADGVMPVYSLFDNEEVGSGTKQGAASTFLFDVLSRSVKAIGGNDEDYLCAVANSFMVSCDNGHAIHPNHPEFSDKNHTVVMNKGVVIKYNANQKYTSDALSSGVMKTVCDMAEIPYQLYCNRADMAGGSTLGNISNTQVSLNTVDIGLAQLAMHSAFETAGAKDTEYLVRALREFYSRNMCENANGYSL